MLPESQKTAYETFITAVTQNSQLDPQTTVLIKLACALSLGCYP